MSASLSLILDGTPVKTLWEVLKHLNGGGLGFDPNRNPLGKKGPLIQHLLTTFPEEKVRAALAHVPGALTPATPAPAPEPVQYDPEPQPEPAPIPEPSINPDVAQAAAKAAESAIAAAGDKLAASVDLDAEVSRILNLPFSQIRSAVGDLVEKANRPPEKVEVIVKEFIDRVTERVVYAPAESRTDAITGRLAPASQGMKPCAEVFGVKVSRPDGSDTMVEVFDCPTDAPDQHFRFDVRSLRLFLSSVKHGRWAWLYGPPGTGKTEFLRNVAARLGRPFFRVNFDGALERYELIGGERLKAGTTEWLEGILTIALTTPHSIVDLDEVSFGRPEHLSAMHGVLEPLGAMTIPETGKVIRRADGVFIAATDNTNGGGDLTGAFAGTRPMNRAFVNRFACFIPFDYLDAVTEAQLLHDRTGIRLEAARMLTDFAARARVSVRSGDLSEAPSLRIMVPLAEYLIDGVEMQDAFTAACTNRLDPASAEALKQVANATINDVKLAEAVAGK